MYKSKRVVSDNDINQNSLNENALWCSRIESKRKKIHLSYILCLSMPLTVNEVTSCLPK